MQRPVQKLTALLSIPCQYFLPIVHQHNLILRDSERGVGGGGGRMRSLCKSETQEQNTTILASAKTLANRSGNEQ